MGLITFICVAIVLLALGLYAVQLLPLPGSSGDTKSLIMLALVLLAIGAIAYRAGII